MSRSASDLLLSVKQSRTMDAPSKSGGRAVDAPAYLPPSIVLLVTFDDYDTELAVPAHALVWAATRSPRLIPCLDLLARPPSPDSDPVRPSLDLPTFSLRLPTCEAWSLLHDYVYLQSTKGLLEQLVNGAAGLPDGQASDAVKARRQADVWRLDLVRKLWLNVVALEIAGIVADHVGGVADSVRADYERLAGTVESFFSFAPFAIVSAALCIPLLYLGLGSVSRRARIHFSFLS